MKILVTGGASGLGAAIVKKLAGNSTNEVYFTYAHSVAAAKELVDIYANSKAIQCDFTDKDSLDGFINLIQELDVDVLVNNATGKIHKEHFYKTNPGVFIKSFEDNILSTVRITQEAIKGFRKKRFGKIINIISSAIVNKPPMGWSIYVANKAYLLSMSNSWATEYIKFNITSNCISPSFMKTNLTSDTDDRIITQMEEDHPLKKLLTVDEAADAVLFLVNASQQVNGTNMVINAGADIK